MNARDKNIMAKEINIFQFERSDYGYNLLNPSIKPLGQLIPQTVFCGCEYA